MAEGEELEPKPSKKTKHKKFMNKQILEEKFMNEIENDEKK